jgi:hypothetical protein
VSYAGAVRRRVAPYPVDEDANTVKLSPRLIGYEDRSRPELFIAKVSNVGLAGSRCYEHPVLVDEHDHIDSSSCPQSEHERPTTAASTLRGERWPLSSAVGMSGPASIRLEWWSRPAPVRSLAGERFS